tara:strand:+ start:372 stop:629 length:258 start_codon:yes stop_codon:yes gene_type:complete
MNKNLRIGAVLIIFLIITIICLSVNIYRLNKENTTLNSSVELMDKEIVRINKVSYKRFVIASDLTDICNKFKSSRLAKKEYYLNN